MIRYKFTKAEYAFTTLSERRLKATKPNEFNDVFEFCPVSDSGSYLRHSHQKLLLNPEWIRKLYDAECGEGYERSYEHFRDHDLDNRLEAHFAPTDLSGWDLTVRNDASNYVAVICLSRNCRMYLQWSYYADCHRGCAIGVDVHHKCFERARLNEPVTYTTERPKYFWDLDKEARLNQLRAISKTKSEVWKHEREHRLAYRWKIWFPKGRFISWIWIRRPFVASSTALKLIRIANGKLRQFLSIEISRTSFVI